MARVLSGVQPSGRLHLGNYCGAIQQFVELQRDHELFVFIASYHALTSTRDGEAMRQQVREAAMDALAFGIDPDHCAFYRQQDVPQVTELAWLLSCVCPKSQMDKQVAYKDKVGKGLSASLGLYAYPVLQAADILAVDPDVVPVGKDQQQNVEIARDLAQKFNRAFGETFKAPEGRYRAEAAALPGIDGEKMSKSYGNTINVFEPEKALRKRVMKIVTDSKGVDDPKEPEGDVTFQLFAAVAGADDPATRDLADRYRAGGMGYGHAKQALFELLMDRFAGARERRAQLEADPGRVDEALTRGADRARAVVGAVTARARKACGLD
ncbi:MAG: tryptophan--tRNA ligase [Planctomycetota bacterium]